MTLDKRGFIRGLCAGEFINEPICEIEFDKDCLPRGSLHFDIHIHHAPGGERIYGQ
ncbi:hypothetical protein [Tardiphaga sp.]|uniref:hypothetical protein n=1 Tax=Tardiphaga sp. TaxID=1926292 RepID=UPI00352B510C